MIEKITAIVLDITRHNDKVNIVNLFTRQHGRMGVVCPAGSSRNSRLRQARLQPLAVIEADINLKPNAELQRLGSFSLSEVWTDIYFNPLKRAIVLFLSEFLNNMLRASMPDEAIWDYICRSLSLLDNMEKGISDFHIAFLSSLLPFAGIQPDITGYRQGMAFDMRNGTFKEMAAASRHPETLTGEEAYGAFLLSRVNFSNIKGLRLNSQTRMRMLRGLLSYYSIHFPGAGNLKSLDILHELFS